MIASAPVVGALVAAVVLVAAARVGGRSIAPPRVVVATAATIRLPRRWPSRRILRRPRQQPTDADVAAWCQRIAGNVRAGRSLTAAVVDADAATPAARRPCPDVVLAVSRGRSLADAFRAVPDDPSTGIGLAAPVLAACADVGGPAAGAVDRVVDVLLARVAERDERRSASAQARLSARVMTTVPFAVAALLAVTEPSMRATMATAAGRICLGVGSVLNLVGWRWMRTMIAVST